MKRMGHSGKSVRLPRGVPGSISGRHTIAAQPIPLGEMPKVSVFPHKRTLLRNQSLFFCLALLSSSSI